MTVLALALLVSLGQWQVHRLNWKNELIATMDARVYGEPRALPKQYDDLEAWSYMRVSVHGVFDHDNEAHLHTLGPRGIAGYDIYTPFKLDDGRTVIINRGFVPTAMKNVATRAEGQVAGEVSIVGLARLSRDVQWYMPKNNTVKNVWFTPVLSKMASFMGVSTPIPLFVDADEAVNQGGYPIGGQTVLNMPNNHLDYALTWYGLALVLLVIYLLYVRRTFEDSDDDQV